MGLVTVVVTACLLSSPTVCERHTFQFPPAFAHRLCSAGSSAGTTDLNGSQEQILATVRCEGRP